MQTRHHGRPTVLHVLEAVGGGTAKHLLDLVTHVDGVRHVAVVPERRVGGLSDDTIVPRLRAAGADVHVVPMQRRPLSLRNMRAVLRLRRLLRHVSPDVVHAHASIAGALTRIAVGAETHRFVWTPHAINTGRLYAAAERLLFRHATVVALSDSEEELIQQLGVGSADRLHVIPNGVEPVPPAGGFDLRARLAIPADAAIVGTVARLVPQKAPLDFVHVCAQVAAARQDVHFVLIGEGPLADAVDEEVGRLGLTPRFHRLSCPTGASAVVGQFDAFLLTSRYEGAPYTPLEAMVAGVPVVVTGCVGTRDTVIHDANGLVAEPGDVDALAVGTLRLLGDELLRARLCRNAAQTVRERFDIDAVAARYNQLYNRLAAVAPVPAVPAVPAVAPAPAVPAARVPEFLGAYRGSAVVAEAELESLTSDESVEFA